MDAYYSGEVAVDGDTHQPHGVGTAVYTDQRQYHGQWHRGLYDGHGKETYGPDDVNHLKEYDGVLKNGKRHGEGTMTWTSGERHHGTWLNDVICKYGVREWASGEVYAGEWRDNEMHGLGVKWDADGKRTYCGRWEHDTFQQSCGVPLSMIPTHSSARQRFTKDGLHALYVCRHCTCACIYAS